MSDQELATVIQSQSSEGTQSQDAQSAFEELYQRHSRNLLAFLTSRTKTRTQGSDVAQETWMRVWKNLSTQFDGNNFRAWLYRIAKNLLIDLYRKKDSVAPSEHIEAIAVQPDLDDSFQADQIEQLQGCMKKLDEKLRDVVVERLAGQSYDAISEKLGANYNTVQTRFHRAKDELKKCVQNSKT